MKTRKYFTIETYGGLEISVKNSRSVKEVRVWCSGGGRGTLYIHVLVDELSKEFIKECRDKVSKVSNYSQVVEVANWVGSSLGLGKIYT
jgi:hypothetical protein